MSSVVRSVRRLDKHTSIRVGFATLVAVAMVLAGCGDKKKDKPASQTAAKVNKQEITVHQINFVLEQQRGLPPAQAASAGKQVLERLIDQELALQKAQDQKIDRDPRVVQQLEAARREIIARAYVERIGASAPKPSAEEIKSYYDSHPALFKERRIYNLQELSIQAAPDQIEPLRTKLAGAKGLPEFVDYLKANDFKFVANQAVRSAEQLPLTVVDKIALMKDGQSVFSVAPAGAQVVVLVSSRGQPVDETRAAPAIEQFLLNERKRKLVEEDLKGLRGASKIEYVGDYANGGSVVPMSKAAAAAPAANFVTPVVPVGPIASAAPQLEVEPINLGTASGPGPGTLEKGLKGIK